MDNQAPTAPETNAYTTPSEGPTKTSGKSSTPKNTTPGGHPGGQPGSQPGGQPGSQPGNRPTTPCSCTEAPSSMSVCMCEKLAALRAPAMTVRYHMEKRHIPDLDAERKRNSHKPASGQPSSDRGDCDCTLENEPSAERMLCRGTWTVRYFDLAVGAMALVAMGCLVKGCLCMCGMMKNK